MFSAHLDKNIWKKQNSQWCYAVLFLEANVPNQPKTAKKGKTI
jgi:hypothetical protein